MDFQNRLGACLKVDLVYTYTNTYVQLYYVPVTTILWNFKYAMLSLNYVSLVTLVEHKY